MARPRKPIFRSQPPELTAIWGHVPVDDPAELDRMATLLPSLTSREALQKDLIGTSHWLNMMLYERKRSDPKAVRAELEDLHRKLQAAWAALLSLGYDASKALEERAKRQNTRRAEDGGEVIWQWLEPKGFNPSGKERVRWVQRVLADVSRWTAEARSGIPIPRVIIDPPDPDDPTSKPTRRVPGAPRDDDARAAIISIIELWEEQTGTRPTIITDPASGQKRGPFLELCRRMIVPIYHANGFEPPSIEALAKEQLYPARQRRER